MNVFVSKLNILSWLCVTWGFVIYAQLAKNESFWLVPSAVFMYVIILFKLKISFNIKLFLKNNFHTFLTMKYPSLCHWFLWRLLLLCLYFRFKSYKLFQKSCKKCWWVVSAQTKKFLSGFSNCRYKYVSYCWNVNLIINLESLQKLDCYLKIDYFIEVGSSYMTKANRNTRE